MLQLLVLQLWACNSLVEASGSDASVGGSFGSSGQGRQEGQVMIPWASQQWWWLTEDPLSLPRGQTEETSTRRDKTGQEALSVLVPFDQSTREEVKRLVKRPCKSGGGRSVCRRSGIISVPFREMWKNWKSEYLSVPEDVVQLSQKQQAAGDSACRDLTVQLFTVDVGDQQIDPLWDRDSLYIGMCPSRLQKRKLGDNVWPPMVVESVCLCRQSACSNLGGEFHCQNIRRPITVWLRRESSYFPSHETISVGCFCGQRISQSGQYAEIGLTS